jgi:TRAP-type C4-dicarboxylate transport system permease large subunit
MSGYIIAIALFVRLFPGHAPAHDDDAPRLSFAALAAVLPIALIFMLVFGGIYGGLFTPTEGAAVGAAATFVAALLRGEITWAKFRKCFYATAQASAMIFMIFIGADVMNAALALTQVPAQLAAFVDQLGWSPLWVVSAIMLFYVVSGCVMDELSVMLLTIPIFFPVVIGLDFGMSRESVAIWFGILVLMTVGFGLLTPPVGLNVYIVNGLAKDVPMGETYRGVMPFLVSDVLRTMLFLFFPIIPLWLVGFIR